MRSIIVFLLSICILESNLKAQKIFSEYHDGLLYIKLKSSYHPKTRLATAPNYKYDINKLPFKTKLDPKFGISKFGNAFEIEADEKLNSTMVMEFKNIHLVEELIATLQNDPHIDYIEKVPIVKTHLTPNDPLILNQWHITRINARAAWNYASTGSNIVVAIVDDAIQRSHPDLAPNLWVNPGEVPNNNIDDDANGFIDDINGWDVAGGTNNVDPPTADFDHGTHVAGIASAATNNGIGITSIGFSCKLMCIKATNNASTISAGYAGILYAANNGAHVINMSWGGPGSSVTNENVINYALSKGCILVASAGNDNSTSLRFPAAYAGVISVASTNENDDKSDFSNYGNWVKISAPGSGILSTTVGSNYGNKSGTSMASPMVAGLIGLMKFLNPTMPNSDIIQCLYNSADPLTTFTGQLGAGRINAEAAMACVSTSLNRPPIPDFFASTTQISAGGQVTFTDQSSYNPTSWQWSFPGGTPSVFNGKSPPPVQYNTPGQYSVTLTVSNAFGSPVSLTKNNYITVSAAPTCLRVNLPFPSNWEIVNYSVGNDFEDGHVNGINAANDKQKAMFFNLFNTANTTLSSVAIGFGSAFSNNPLKPIVIRVLDGSSAQPGAVLASKTITIGQIMSDIANARLTFIDFSEGNVTLPSSKQFFVAVDFSSLSWETGNPNTDSLGIFSNISGQTIGTPIWNFGSDNRWRRYGTTGTWNVTNKSLLIHPYVTPNGAKSVLNPKNPVICSGNSVAFNATGSTFGDLFQWQLPGASPPQVINNQMVINPIYPSMGSFKAYLLTRGGCNEVRIDSTIVTVNQTPVVNVVATKNPICVGESTTITATGATSFTWSPGTGLNTTNGSVVTANPTHRITYSISGTMGNCSTVVPFELFVNARTTSVALNASANSINGPTLVTFSAVPNNGGANPIFNFFVNNLSVQSGNSNTLARIVSPGDVIKCQLTSSEPCVDEKTVLSNEITMGNALPVTLIRFTGRNSPSGNLLEWTTSTEVNSQEFVVERSIDGIGFGLIARVKAAGASSNPIHYNVIDNKFGSGKNFYRLKMVDKDGSFKYSPIVLIENGSGLILTTLLPNPTQAGLQSVLSISGLEVNSVVHISVANAAGATLKHYTAKSASGTGIIQQILPANNLPAGTYFVLIKGKNGKLIETVRWHIIK